MSVFRYLAHGVQGLHSRPVLSKGETDPNAPAKALILLLHGFYVALLFADLSVLRHVLNGGEVVVVAGIDLGVQRGDEGCRVGTKVGPMDVFEERMGSDLVQVRITDAGMGDKSVIRRVDQ